MKALSYKQPWAYLVAAGIKPIENRTWKLPKKYKGQRILIHASGKSEKGFVNTILSHEQFGLVLKSGRIKELEAWKESAIIGSVEIVDCVLNHESIWAQHKSTKKVKLHTGQEFIVEVPVYNWVLANPILFPESIPKKGKLSFWDYPNILAEPEEKDGELFCHCQLPVKEVNQVVSFIDHYRCRYCGGRWYK